MAGRILMFSMGLDSFILKQVYQFKNEECLFVRMGTEENRIEESLIDKLYPGVVKTELPISQFELPNKIIPFRNHFLALLGAQYASSIYFGFTLGDTTKDKDYVFKAQIEGILNYFATSPEKVKYGAPYTVNMPYKHLTKTQIVKKYLDSHFPAIDLLTKSSSCYNGGDIACGMCRSCLRKFVALYLNDIDTDGFFINNPSHYLDQFLEESIIKNRVSELSDIQQCIIKVKGR
jgi:7-cyano-7-deazaguanine synthase in queuosine biosynthesis